MNAWLRRHQLLTYFVGAYVLSWSIAVPLALQAQRVVSLELPWAMHYLTAFGPAAAAVILSAILRQPLRLQRSGAPASSAIWWAVGLFSPLVLFAIAQLSAWTAGQPVLSWTELGRLNFLPDLGLAAWALWFATSGCGEELGWRAFALPRLQRRHSAFSSSVLLSIAWAGWHLPAFFYLPSYSALGVRVLPGFFVGILAGTIVLTWLFNSSRGSILSVVLWHASFNFVTGSPNAAGLPAAVTSTLVIVWAVAILWRYEWTTLAERTHLPATAGRV